MPVTKRRDDGAVATVFALLLTGGVLLGFMALVVDVGQIYVERGELMTGADAAALGVAKACATDQPGCDSRPSALALAQRYADDNSSDGVSHVDTVCGVMPRILVPCPEPATNRTACLGSPPTEGNWVEVRISTEVPGNKLVLPPSFAQGVMEDFDGASIGACARVAWREPTVVNILKLAMSECAYDAAEDEGFVDPPPYPPYPDLNDQLWLGEFPSCAGTNGRSMPSAALIEANGGNCQFEMPADGVVPGRYLRDEDTTVGPTCLARLRTAVDNQERVFLPVYNRVGPGPTPSMRVARLAEVVITGYDLGPGPGERHDNGNRGQLEPGCEPPPPGPGPGGPGPGPRPDEWWEHRCVSVFVVGQLDLSALVADASVDLIG